MITSGLEDYLELIYNTVITNNDIKAIDIANKFNISRASVSEALTRLANLELIVYEGRKGLKITPKGINEAKKIIKKHQTLCKFFHEILGVDLETANENACRIEHVIDRELVEKISSFTDYCQKTEVIEGFLLKNDK